MKEFDKKLNYLLYNINRNNMIKSVDCGMEKRDVKHNCTIRIKIVNVNSLRKVKKLDDLPCIVDSLKCLKL